MHYRVARGVGAFWIQRSFSLITQASPVAPLIGYQLLEGGDLLGRMQVE